MLIICFDCFGKMPHPNAHKQAIDKNTTTAYNPFVINVEVSSKFSFFVIGVIAGPKNKFVANKMSTKIYSCHGFGRYSLF